jgi:hypothetical protein
MEEVCKDLERQEARLAAGSRYPTKYAYVLPGGLTEPATVRRILEAASTLVLGGAAA